MNTVHLHGELGERFGREWQLEVSTPAEVFRAIEANRPGLRNFLIESSSQGVGYRVIVGERDIEVGELVHPLGAASLTIVPVVAGAGKGLLGIVAGAALIYFSGGMAAPLIAAGWSATAAAMVGSVAMSVGISLVLGGVSQMLVKTPQAPPAAVMQEISPMPTDIAGGAVGSGSGGGGSITAAAAAAAPEAKNSYFFAGPLNRTQQGGPVPVGYGRLIIGSVVVGASVRIENIAV